MDTQDSGFVAESQPQDVTASLSGADVEATQSSGLSAESQSRNIISRKETETEAAQSLGPQAKMQSHNSSYSKSPEMEATESSGFMAKSESQDTRTPSEESKPKTTQSSGLRVRWKSQVTTSSDSIGSGLEGTQSSGLLADSKSTDKKISIKRTEMEAAESSGSRARSQFHSISSSNSIETEAAKSSGRQVKSQSHISSSEGIETEVAESPGARAKTQSHNTSSNKSIETEAAHSSGFMAKSKPQDTGTSSEETKPNTAQSSNLGVRWKSQVIAASRKTEKEAAQSSGPATELQSHSSENIVVVASSTHDHVLTDSPSSSDEESVYVDAIVSLHFASPGSPPESTGSLHSINETESTLSHLTSDVKSTAVPETASEDSVFTSSYYSFNLIPPDDSSSSDEDNAVDDVGGDSPGSSNDEAGFASSDDNAEESSDEESVYVDAVASFTSDVPAGPAWGSTESSVGSEASGEITMGVLPVAQITPPIPQIVLTPPDHEVDRFPPTLDAGLLHPAIMRMHVEVRPASRSRFLDQNSLSSEYRVRPFGLSEDDDDVGESAHIENVGEVGDSDF